MGEQFKNHLDNICEEDAFTDLGVPTGEVGELRCALEKTSLADTTVVVFT